jgi:hypothetical protein
LIETSVVETIAGRVERELERVRAARPGLASRVSRAEGILVTYLSCRRQRMIRVRVSGGHARFLVASQGSKGAVYVVDPASWECYLPGPSQGERVDASTTPCLLGTGAGVGPLADRIGFRRGLGLAEEGALLRDARMSGLFRSASLRRGGSVASGWGGRRGAWDGARLSCSSSAMAGSMRYWKRQECARLPRSLRGTRTLRMPTRATRRYFAR